MTSRLICSKIFLNKETSLNTEVVIESAGIFEEKGSLSASVVANEETVTKVSVKAMEEKSLTDKELVRLAARRDKDAYRVLVEKYQARAFNIAFDLLRNKEDAEDVVQESFVKAYLSLPSFKNQSSFYTWLYRIVYNMSIDFKRKIGRSGGQALEFDDTLHGDVGEVATVGSYAARMPYDEMLRKEQADIINQAMSSISDEHRAVIMFRELEGMNYDQIAEVIGVSKGTIMSRLHYARKKLQEVLKELLKDGAHRKGSDSEQGGQDTKLSPEAC